MFLDEKVEGTVFMSRKQLIINDEVAYKRTIKCANAVELKNVA
jgi:hypothetical protein